jgi:hypothetical protein
MRLLKKTKYVLYEYCGRTGTANTSKGSYNNLSHEIKHCPNAIFISPVTEEVVSLAKNLKNKLTAGYDDIPKSLVKQCIQLIKELLTHIYNVSPRSGVFPDE